MEKYFDSLRNEILGILGIARVRDLFAKFKVLSSFEYEGLIIGNIFREQITYVCTSWQFYIIYIFDNAADAGNIQLFFFNDELL